MSESERRVGLGRRHFVKGVGVIAGAMALAPLRPLWELTGGTASPLKLGILLPSSSVYPDLAESLTAGMRLFFERDNDQAGGHPIELMPEAIGFGPSLAIRKSRKLIEEDQADLVVGVVSSTVAFELRDIFQESRTVLLVNNIGANVVRPAEWSPYIFHNTLNYWQTNWAMGAWAVEHLGRRAFVATSFYDSGYDTLYAFRRGFEGAGGEIIQTFTTHIPPDSGDPAPLIAAIEQTRPDFVYALYCGQPAADFVKAYAASGLTGRIPLAGSGFLVAEDLLPAQGEAALGAKSGLTWASSLPTPENRAFTAAYQARTGRPADPFAVLGYDTARLIDEAVNAVEGDIRRTDQLLGALSSAEFTSPRGRFMMNPKTHTASSPLYLREVRWRGSAISNMVVAELGPIPELDERVQMAQSGLKTGWLNAYLCL